MQKLHFFDSASTTQCIESASQILLEYTRENYGNPSSAHRYGTQAAKAISNARAFFASIFKVGPEQVIFTGSGTEANNLALLGPVFSALAQPRSQSGIKVLVSSVEHPSIRKPAESLRDLGVLVEFIPVSSEGQIIEEQMEKQITSSTSMVSIQQVNSILGTILPTERLARKAKSLSKKLLFHSDGIQAFGKLPMPDAQNSAIDLLSLSGHKVGGPKGVGALIILNKKLLASKAIRPLIWGGEHESGLRSGTQNAGLIAAFHVASEERIKNREHYFEKVKTLQIYFKQQLINSKLLEPSSTLWNSPESASPYIVSLSFPRLPSSPLAKLLEERHCLVSVGSACSSKKIEADPVLEAIGLPEKLRGSTLRISFSPEQVTQDIDILVEALSDSIQTLNSILKN